MKAFWANMDGSRWFLVAMLVANLVLLGVNEGQLQRIENGRQSLEKTRAMIMGAIVENNRRMEAWNAQQEETGDADATDTAGSNAADRQRVKPCVQGQDLAPGESCSVAIELDAIDGKRKI